MPKEAQICVLYVQPGKYPEERVIEHTLAAVNVKSKCENFII